MNRAVDRGAEVEVAWVGVGIGVDVGGGGGVDCGVAVVALAMAELVLALAVDRGVAVVALAMARNVSLQTITAKSFKTSEFGGKYWENILSGTGENLKLPPKQTILRNLAVNEASHDFVSPCEKFRLPPKVSKYSNLAVNTYETAQAQPFRMY